MKRAVAASRRQLQAARAKNKVKQYDAEYVKPKLVSFGWRELLGQVMRGGTVAHSTSMGLKILPEADIARVPMLRQQSSSEWSTKLDSEPPLSDTRLQLQHGHIRVAVNNSKVHPLRIATSRQTVRRRGTAAVRQVLGMHGRPEICYVFEVHPMAQLTGLPDLVSEVVSLLHQLNCFQRYPRQKEGSVVGFPLPVHPLLRHLSTCHREPKRQTTAELYARTLFSGAVYHNIYNSQGKWTNLSVSPIVHNLPEWNLQIVERLQRIRSDLRAISERAWLDDAFHATLMTSMRSPTDRRVKKKTILGSFSRSQSPVDPLTYRLVSILGSADQVGMLLDVHPAFERLVEEGEAALRRNQ